MLIDNKKTYRGNEIVVSGVYQITNTRNGYQYIGQSSNVLSRWANHVADLKAGNHSNGELQEDWCLYSEDEFEFKLLFEVGNANFLIKREAQQIKNRLQAGVNLYNNDGETRLEKKWQRNNKESTKTANRQRGQLRRQVKRKKM